MKDIDFDELDRAVSSVLGQPAAVDTKPSQPVPEPTGEPKPVAVDSSRMPQKDLVQKRRSGRFMDVVPSSRSKNSNLKPAVSRQGANISPVSEAEPLNSTPPVDDPKSNAIDSTKSNDSIVRSREEDTKLKQQISEQDEAHDALASAASELTGLNGLIHADDEASPLDTPFVSDYDVKKRPLGAFSIGETDHSLLDEDAKRYRDSAEADGSESGEPVVEIDTHMNDAIARELRNHEESEGNAPKAKKDKDPATEDSTDAVVKSDQPVQASSDELPGELQDEMLAIASKPVGELSASEPKVDPTPAPVEKEAAPQPQPQAHLATNNGSITQQYKSEDKTQSEEITPVFDTDSYHKPLTHVKKKKSGWLSVLLITLLVILGAGAGAAMYIFDPFGLL